MRLILAVLTSSLILLFAGFASAGEPIKVLRFGAVATGGTGKPSGSGVAEVAQANGFFDEEFAKEGIKVEITYFAGTGPAINEALAQGQLEFGFSGAFPNVVALAGGVPTHLIFATHSAGTPYYLAAQLKLPIASIADLKGRRVAVQKATNPHLALVLLLADNGLSEQDVKIVNLQRPEAQAAFTADAVDAAFSGTNLLILRDQGYAKIVGSTKSWSHAEANVSGTLVNVAFEKAHPDIVARVVKVLTKTSYWLTQDQNRAAYLQLVAKSGFPEKYIPEEYQGSFKERFNPLIDPWVREGYRQNVAFALSQKLIRRAPDLSNWFTPQYLDAALKDLQIEGFWAPVTVASAAPLPR